MRCPGRALVTAAPCDSSARIRAGSAPGCNTTVASRSSVPLHRVPVTTVPVPFTVKARSIGRRTRSAASRAGTLRAAAARAARNSGSPAPVMAEQATIGAPSSGEPATSARTSSVSIASHSASTRSLLVSAMTPARTPSRVRMARCSRVCGMGPSSAAMTRSARSTPVAPANIVRTKASCPGTSTILISTPSSVSGAKPSSMVMPRRFSSGRRSVSTPVRARTSAVLP